MLLAQLVRRRDHLLPTVSHLSRNGSSAGLLGAPLQSMAHVWRHNQHSSLSGKKQKKQNALCRSFFRHKTFIRSFVNIHPVQPSSFLLSLYTQIKSVPSLLQSHSPHLLHSGPACLQRMGNLPSAFWIKKKRKRKHWSSPSSTSSQPHTLQHSIRKAPNSALSKYTHNNTYIRSWY